MTLSSLATEPLPTALPSVVELSPTTNSVEVFRALSGLPHAIFFDSAMRHESLGRYSYVAADPIDWFSVPADGSPALHEITKRLERLRVPRVEGLPPWQGGLAGLIGYEIGCSLERLPRPKWDEFGMPALAMGLYDTVVAFDHMTGRAWAISHGWKHPAEQRIESVLNRIQQGETTPLDTSCSLPQLLRKDLAPTFEMLGHTEVLSDFSREGYIKSVERVMEHLRAGDAYQVNLSQRLLTPDPGDPVAMYLRLRNRNPAPFAGYLDGGDWQVASASPERFLRLDSGKVETRPIKGTRPRGKTPDDDKRIGAELIVSEKDRAENVMIVDLMRNDLSRVCTDASVEVEALFSLEKYAHVQHLVSVMRGELRIDLGPVDLLAATLPAGSITGAPKVRAQQIIAELEPTARGAYCGSLAWIGPPDESGRQAMDSNVLIRTLTAARGWIQAPVGGGIVVQSNPEHEYEETWHKAEGLMDQ